MAKINIDQVEPNSTVLLKGVVAFSRIASQIKGEELEVEKKRRADRGQIPPTRPFTSLTLHSVELIANDPHNLTLAEQYVAGRCYASANADRQPGLSYTAENKGAYLPAVGVKNADGSYTQVYPTSELAPGQEVIILIRIFDARMHHGCTFDAVLVQAPEVQYRNAGGMRLTNDLASRGIVWHATAEPTDVSPDDMAEQVANTIPLADVAMSAPVTQQAAPAPAAAAPAATAVPIAGMDMTGGIQYDPNAR